MSELVFRPVAEGEQRAVHQVLAEALHGTPPDDANWALIGESFPADRKFAAFAGATPVGMVSSFATEFAVPGGKTLAAAAVDGVAVRADHIRRGIVSKLLREQLADCRGRGELIALLHASEATIYGRFGYAPAMSVQRLRVSTTRARMRPEAPVTGRVRLLDKADAMSEIPELYARIGLYRPGMIRRPQLWWPHYHDRFVRDGYRVAVHTGPGGDDGFVVFRVLDQRDYDHPERLGTVEVRELHAADPGAAAGLWRFLLALDLTAEIQADNRPVDEPLRALVTDIRGIQSVLTDHVWIRLLDVEAALAARTYRDGPPVVVAVSDELLPENSGTYRIGPGGVSRTAEPADLVMTVELLSQLYLGEWQAGALAGAGRIEARDLDAAARFDELFRPEVRPWCGTYF